MFHLNKKYFYLCTTSGCNSTSSSPTGNPPSQSKGHGNPYARPLSAKDIVSDLQNQQKIKKTPSGTQMQSAPNGMFQNGAGTPMFGFPMNAFMRPQSALRKETKTKVTEGSKVGTREAFTNKPGQTKTTPRKSIPPTKLEREQDLSETSNMTKDLLGNQTKKSFGPAKVESSPGMLGSKQELQSNGNISSQSKVAVASQTQNSSVAKVNGIKTVANNNSNNTKTIAYAKPVSSLPRPGSAAPSRTSPEAQAKVRNLNYTPTKPYHEVSDPSDSSKPPVSSNTRTLQTTETAITVKTDVLPKGTTYMAPTNMLTEQKVYGANPLNGLTKPGSIASGTMYYRKESKLDVMIHEQRPPAVGAPSKPPRGAEKMSNNANEYDEADDESEVPSG